MQCRKVGSCIGIGCFIAVVAMYGLVPRSLHAYLQTLVDGLNVLLDGLYGWQARPTRPHDDYDPRLDGRQFFGGK